MSPIIVLGLVLLVAPQIALGQPKQTPDKLSSPNASTPQASGSTQPTNELSTPTPVSVIDNATREGIKLTDWLQAGISAALLIVIIVQAYIYQRQRQVMERQLSAMRDSLGETRTIVKQNERAVAAAEIQAHAAETSAIAARESAAIAREAFETIERANIVISYMGSQGFRRDGVKPAVVIEFTNTGRTSAYNFVSLVEMVTGKSPSLLAWQPKEFSAKVSGEFIPPSVSKRLMHPQDGLVPTPEEHATSSKEDRLFGMVEAAYTDFRGANHTIRFRGIFDWDSGRFQLDDLAAVSPVNQ